MAVDMFAPLTEAELALSKGDDTASRPGLTPIVPVPDDAPAMDYEHPRLGKPDKSWLYRDAERRRVAYVCRWNTAGGGKEVRPVTFCDHGDGTQGWRSHGLPAPRPLFTLPDILARPDAPVIITEGEKSCEAAALLFPDYVATTAMNGAMSPGKTDFRPLAGRTVIISTDYDEPGRNYGEQVHRLLREAGAKEILHLRPEDVARVTWVDGKPVERAGDIPAGWDLADAVDDGWAAESLTPHIESHDLLKPFAATTEKESAFPDGFRLTERGVEYWAENDDGGYWTYLCSPLIADARTRNPEGEDWGLLLRITDADGRTKELVMPGHLLADEGAECRRLLLTKGVDIAPGRRAQAALQALLSLARPVARVTTVDRTGWQEDIFVLPDRAIASSNAGDRIIFPRAAAEAHPYEAAGTLEGWQERVATLAIGNSRLVFAISTAFVGPLLAPTASESGGFHFRGPSSIGKTTALQLATSVWGGQYFPATWRATSNGLEGVAAARSDTLLVLDEIGQCSAKEVGDVVYMLGNGVGKQRANRLGDPRSPKRFRCCFLSSGEVSIADKIREDSRYRHTTGGQEVRIVDVLSDAGRGYGLFESLPAQSSAETLARQLKAACSRDQGHAGVAFVERLVADRQGALEYIAAVQSRFVEKHCPRDADGQVLRVATRFGLVAAAGELATHYGILPWSVGEALRAAATCFRAWIEERGGTESHETRTHVERVRHFLEQNAKSRFEHLKGGSDGDDDEKAPLIRDRAGFRVSEHGNDDVYCISPEVWRKDVCVGLDPKRVAETLNKKGMLNRSKGRLQKQKRIPGVKEPLWFYQVNSSIFEQGGDGESQNEAPENTPPPKDDVVLPAFFRPAVTPEMRERLKKLT